MKYLNAYLFVILFILLFTGCIKDIDITAPGQETTIVYALFDIRDTKHFVRIEKAFLDKEKSALVMAKETDSIYYGDILKVTVTDMTNGTVYTLNKVYGDTTGIPKDTGIFSNTPNVLYAFDATLQKDHPYKLIVKNTQSGNEVYSQIMLANIPKFLFPISGIEIGIVDTIPYTIKWQTQPNDKVFDLIVRFNYSERNIITNTTIFKSYEYIALKGISSNGLGGGETIEKKINKTEIYKRLALYLKQDINLERRVVAGNTLEFILYAAGDEYDKYLQIKNAQGGITSLSYLPTYTNVNNGLGLVSSRTYSKVNNITISQVSRDSLAYGYYTKDLGFLP